MYLRNITIAWIPMTFYPCYSYHQQWVDCLRERKCHLVASVKVSRTFRRWHWLTALTSSSPSADILHTRTLLRWSLPIFWFKTDTNGFWLEQRTSRKLVMSFMHFMSAYWTVSNRTVKCVQYLHNPQEMSHVL